MRRAIDSLRARLGHGPTPPSSAPAPTVPPPPSVPDGGIRVDLVAARGFLERGRAALAGGDVDAAERCAARAIELEPGWYAAFHLLGDALARRGDRAAAEAARAGTPKEETVARLFARRGDVIAPPPAGAAGLERTRCHPATEHPLPAPLAVVGHAPVPLAAGVIRARAAWVDRLHDARVWHDAQTTLVLDREGREAKAHAKRAAALARRLGAGAAPMRVPGRLIVLGAPGAGNYYHWLIDILPKLALLETAGLRHRPTDRFLLSIRRGRFQTESLARLGIDASRLIFTKESSPWIAADELVVPYLQNGMGASMGAWLPASLRELFAADLGLVSPGPPSSPAGGKPSRRLYVGRDPARSQGRGVLNQRAVDEVLRARSVEVVYPETLSFVEQTRLFAEASLVVAPHGAGLANLVFTPSGSTVVECFGPHFEPCYRAISALNGLRYHALFAASRSDGAASDRQSADFTIDVAALARTLDAIDRGDG